MVELFANSGDPDQTPRSVASDLGLHCLPTGHLGLSGVQLVKITVLNDANYLEAEAILMSTRVP